MRSLDKEAQLNSNQLARKIVEIIEEKQASDIVLLDVNEQTSIATYFVLGTVDNERQANAIRDDLWQQLRIEEKMRPLNVHDLRQEGGRVAPGRLRGRNSAPFHRRKRACAMTWKGCGTTPRSC